MAKVLPVTEPDIIRRLLTQQTEEFFDGAEFLGKRFLAGDSCYLLQLVAIELYFKLIYLNETDGLIFGHEVSEIFALLPKSTRERVFDQFNEFIRPRVSYDDFRGWLKYLDGMVVRIRYPFEEFREMTAEQYEARVRGFLESAANDNSKASIVYEHDRVRALLKAQRHCLGLRDKPAA